MNLKTLLLTNNACYISGKKHTVKGIMWHSTGANNPNLKRYVGPDDGLLGVNIYNNHWNQLKPGGRSICVHAFIGKLADGSIATYQTLPWEMVGWHSGAGAKGTAANANNNGYIGFEICEDALTDAAYFNKVYQEAVELTAMLCKMFKLDPLVDGVVICHSEGYKRGIASDHSDVMHWFPKHNKNMDMARRDVAELLKDKEPEKPIETPEFNIGDIVNFAGGTHYVSSTGSAGSKVAAGQAKITAKAVKAKHPYHLISTDRKISTVYGWVDAATVSKFVEPPTPSNAYLARVLAAHLNIRSGPGIQYKIVGAITDKGTYTIVDTHNHWGKLKSGAGWIALSYVQEI